MIAPPVMSSSPAFDRVIGRCLGDQSGMCARHRIFLFGIMKIIAMNFVSFQCLTVTRKY